MPRPSLSVSDLPQEMILGIYKSLDDHHAITALDLAARKFYDIWSLNRATITQAVLPRVIDCFGLARELAVIQSRSPGGQTEGCEAVAKRLLVNASVVFRDYANLSNLLDALPIANRIEGSAFAQAHYGVWLLVELGDDLLTQHQAQYSRLQAARMEELQDMLSAAEWLEDRASRGDTEYFINGSWPSDVHRARKFIFALVNQRLEAELLESRLDIFSSEARSVAGRRRGYGGNMAKARER